MSLKVYDAGSIVAIFNGIVINGYADGTFISIEQNADAFSLQIGTDGDGTRSRSNNRSGAVTFTLMQSSDTNSLFSALHQVDLNTPGGDGIGPLLIKDKLGATLVTAEKAWIRRFPTSTFDREATSREWTIETDNLVQLVGSSNVA